MKDSLEMERTCGDLKSLRDVNLARRLSEVGRHLFHACNHYSPTRSRLSSCSSSWLGFLQTLTKMRKRTSAPGVLGFEILRRRITMQMAFAITTSNNTGPFSYLWAIASPMHMNEPGKFNTKFKPIRWELGCGSWDCIAIKRHLISA